MSVDNIDVNALTKEQLLAEFERSQWALALVLKRYGPQIFTVEDMQEEPRLGRIWYALNDVTGDTEISYEAYEEKQLIVVPM